MKATDIVYIKRGAKWLRCYIVKLYEECGGTAKVTFGGSEELTCRQSELITVQAYHDLVKQKRKEARILAARNQLAEVIAHWETGRQTPEAMLEASKTGDVEGWAKEIKRAKKFGFIK